MFSNPHTRKPLIVGLIISILVVMMVWGTQLAQANNKARSTTEETIINSPDGDDDMQNEGGVFWVNNYIPIGNNPYDNPYRDDSCLGLYDQLGNAEYDVRIKVGEISVREHQFTQGYYPDGLIDLLDIAMVCTAYYYIYDDYFYYDSIASLKLYDPEYSFVLPAYVYKTIGNSDLEWLAFNIADMLAENNRRYWAAGMDGLHLMLGYSNSVHLSANSQGDLWGRLMNGYFLGNTPLLPPSTVAQAWLKAVDWSEPGGTCAVVLGERQESLNDYLWGKGPVSTDQPVDMFFTMSEHCTSGTGYLDRLSSYKQPQVLSMPVLEVVDRLVDEAYVRDTIAPAFEITGDVGYDDGFYYMAKITGGITESLVVDGITGGFSYHNLSKLWITPVVTPTLPSADVSDVRLNLWFHTTPAEFLPGANYRNAGFEYMVESLTGMTKASPVGENLSEKVISEMPANVTMIYPRKITLTSGTASGTQLVDYPVVGPGGRLMAYLGDGDEIIGVQGGSRDVIETGELVTILESSVVWELFLADHSLAIPSLPYEADLITNSGIGFLAYYEMSYLQPQHELIPVWVFMANFISDGNIIAENVPVYLPAAMEYMPPTVEILTPADGDEFFAGELISFEGSVTGGTPPYTYEWSSSSNGTLGNTLNIVSAIGSAIMDNTVFNPAVTFQVIDANGLTGTATITLAIKPIFWLPVITK